MTSSDPAPGPSGKYKILIVDDHPIVRQGLTHLIDREPNIEVCGGADGATAALREVKAHRPDLVIVDISLNESHGLALIGQIKDLGMDTKMLVWSMHDEKLYAERVLQEGARGYLNKREPTAVVMEAIRRVLAGDIYLSAVMTSQLLHRVGKGQPPEKNSIETLSNRELEVFELIGEGITTQQIARQLGVKPKTVEAHRENIKRKLHLKNSAELNRAAVLYVRESG